MKRHMLKAASSPMFLLLVLVALTGCMHKQPTVPVVPPGKYSIRLWIHGPFVTVLKNNRVSAVMLTPQDYDHEGVFSFGPPSSSGAHAPSCYVTYRFELSGVDKFDGKTKIDPAFDPLRFHVDDWKPAPDEKYFIQLNAQTAPYAINHVGGLMPVRFNYGPPTKVPLTQVLEFTTSDPGSVHLTTTRVENCGTGPQSEKKSDQPLMSCKTLKEKYQDYWNKNQQDPEEPELSERGHIKHELDSCSDNTYFFFIGAGVPPGSKDHGKSFFNGPILQFIYRCLRDNSCSKKKIEAIDKRKIASIGGEVEAPMGDSNLQSPRFVEIDFRSRRLHARFVPVLAVENCKSSGAIVQAEP